MCIHFQGSIVFKTATYPLSLVCVDNKKQENREDLQSEIM